MEFGEKLKQARQEKGFTQQTMADQLYVTRQAVSRWECGARYPDLLTTKKISRILDISIDELLSDERLRENIEREPLLTRSAENIGQTCLYTLVSASYLLMSVFGLYSVLFPNKALAHTPAGRVSPEGMVTLLGYVITFALLFAALNLSARNKLGAKMTGAVMCFPYVMSAVRFLAAYIAMRIRQNGSVGIAGWGLDFLAPIAAAVYIFLYFRSEDRRLPYAVICLICVLEAADIALALRHRLQGLTDLGFVVMAVHCMGMLGLITLLGYQAYVWDQKKKAAYRNTEGTVI